MAPQPPSSSGGGRPSGRGRGRSGGSGRGNSTGRSSGSGRGGNSAPTASSSSSSSNVNKSNPSSRAPPPPPASSSASASSSGRGGKSRRGGGRGGGSSSSSSQNRPSTAPAGTTAAASNTGGSRPGTAPNPSRGPGNNDSSSGGRGSGSGGGRRSGGSGSGGGGRGNSRRQRSNRNNSNNNLHEQKRLEQQRKEAEAAKAAEEERLRKEEEERRRRISEELERRKKLQNDYEARVMSAIDALESVVLTCQKHRELRGQLDPTTSIGNAVSPLEGARTTFQEQTKKSLKSDFKKCTAFVKKLKSGSFPPPSEVTSPNSAIRTLNLSRYVEEVAAAIVEPGGGGSKVKLTDVPGIVALCVEMHRRYEGFVESLVPVLLAGVGGAAGGANPSSANDGDDGSGSSIPRRICLRLLTEFITHGIVTDTKPILKVIAEAAGAPSSSSSSSGSGEGNGSKEYAVTDANLIVTFAKTGGLEILGVLPRSVRLECERLEKEVSGKGDGLLIVVPSEESEASALGESGGENKGESRSAGTEETSIAGDKKDSQLSQSATQQHQQLPQQPNKEVDLEQPFTPTLSASLLTRAQTALQSLQTTVTSPSNLSTLLAIPPPLSNLTKQHCLGAYRTLSNTYLTTHRRLLQLEKRCDQDRLLQGNLSDAREKGLKDAKSLMDSLTKSVEALSEALDLDIPPLPSQEESGNGEGATDGKGIELWTKSDNDSTDPESRARLGPFDDEETRSFYCDVPDLLATNPPAMLGIAAEDVEKKKEKNERQYGGVGGAAVVTEGESGGGNGNGVEESEVVPMEVEEMGGDNLSVGGEGGEGDFGEDGDEGEKEGKGRYFLKCFFER